MKNLYTTLFILFSLLALGQKTELSGFIYDKNGKGIEGVIINNGSFQEFSLPDGSYSIPLLPGQENTVVFSKLGLSSAVKTLTPNHGDKLKLKVTLEENTTELSEVDLVDESSRYDEKIELGEKEIEFNVGPTQGVESLIKTLPGVVGTNEFSSQYNVRGGNFDENLVYVNGIEVYRPFLVRAGQQEGQSFINPDMVESLHFSAGGFEAKYGDKMSSVLDIKYRDPKTFGSTIQASLLGVSATVEGASKDQKFSIITGFRYKTNQILLGSLDTEADFRPIFMDLQLLLKYDLNDRLSMKFFGTIGKNTYNVVPSNRQTDFGTFNEALRLNVYFDGQESYQYTTNSAALSFNWKAADNHHIEWTTSAFQTKENELVDVIGYYRLGELNNNLGSDEFGEVALLRGVGGFQTYGRNFLDAIIASTQINGTLNTLHAGTWLWGVKYQYEDIIDRYKEFEFIDSAGYSVPHRPSTSPPGFTPISPADGVNIWASYDSRNTLIANRLMAYAQNIQQWKDSHNARYKLTLGIRSHYYSVNGQTTISPRGTFSYKPDWEKDWVFRAAVGAYHQPPFYREMRDWEGELHTDIKAQESIHFVLGTDHQFKAWNRYFKWVTEVYYKHMNNLVPYEIENVRIRYYPEASATGYATGIDFRVNGEFVKGIDSWGSLSLYTVKEDIEGDDAGYISRPTDNRFSLAINFQDYLPRDPSFRVSLSFMLVGGFPFAAPKSEPSERVYRSSPYRRVDIGFIKVFKDEKKESKFALFKPFKTVWLGLEVFNLLGTRNTISYLWVRDATTRGQYAVPNYLTGRLVNLKLYLKI